jgi:dCTP deaminase
VADVAEFGSSKVAATAAVLTEVPSQIYGSGIGSHYQAQGLKLSKHFR